MQRNKAYMFLEIARCQKASEMGKTFLSISLDGGQVMQIEHIGTPFIKGGRGHTGPSFYYLTVDLGKIGDHLGYKAQWTA